MPARAAGIDRHTVADREAGNAGADLYDFAGHFVAQDHRFLDPHGAKAAILVVVQVGPADAARPDADHHLAQSGGRVRDLVDAQVARRVDDCGFHDGSPPGLSTPWRAAAPC
jgi:hypothetical protein